MEEWVLLLIALFVIANETVAVVVLINFGVDHSYHTQLPTQDCALPYRMHKASKMNWFGSWCCSLLTFIVLPLPYIFQVIWWLFHIGGGNRKK